MLLLKNLSCLICQKTGAYSQSRRHQPSKALSAARNPMKKSSHTRNHNMVLVQHKKQAEQTAHKTLSLGSFFRNFAAGGLAAGYKEDERSYIEQQFQQYESLKDQYANATTQKDKDRIDKQIKEIETYLARMVLKDQIK